MLEQVLGFFASVVAFVIFIPQAIAVYKNRDNAVALRGASVATNLLLALNAVLWLLYALTTKAFWVAAPGAVNFPLALTSIFLILRARRRAKKKQVTELS